MTNVIPLEKIFDFKNPDYTPLLRDRILRLNKIRADKTGTLLSAHKLIYKKDPVRFIEDWMTTFDPRKTALPYMPFKLFPKQRELIYKVHEAESDILIEKSRDFGISYLMMAYALWSWTFVKGVKVGVGSRKEKYVDNIGDPDSLFEKIRILFKNIPKEFKPTDYDFLYMKIINKENGSVITGEAGDNIGRGGRNTFYIKDESAFYERPEKIEAALSQNSNKKIDISTPNGVGNPFYRRRMDGSVPVFVCDWRDDPRKDQEWYDHQCKILEPWIVAQEIDRDYAASMEGICIPAKWVQAAIEFKIEASGEKKAGLDVADSSGDTGDANALCFRYGPVVESIGAWRHKTTTETARKAYFDCEENGYYALIYESNGVGAGVRGEAKAIKERLKKERSATFERVKTFPINPGSTSLYGYYASGKLNKDMFLNLRAMLWWKIRKRFEKTYERKNDLQHWPDDECISIPNDHDLILELSQPRVFKNESGKLQIESKQKMRSRSVKSGNKADSLIFSEYNLPIVYAA